MFDFSVIVLRGASASSVAMTLDILSTAAACAKKVGCAVPQWRIYSTRKLVRLSNGVSVGATPLPKKLSHDGSVWIIPGLDLQTVAEVTTRFDEPDAKRTINALQEHVRAGGEVAASCSAVFLLRAAGLLDHRRVTTTWWFAGLLQQMAPTCTVDGDRLLVVDKNIVTGGAAFAQIDVMLYLLRTRFNPTLAEAVSRNLLIDGRGSQAQFIVPAALANGNELVGKLVSLYEARLRNPPSIERLATELCMSSRTLSRHVKVATGRSTSALLQHVRISRARMLLEAGNLTIEQIAEEIGYGDTTALRRLMRKLTGSTPRQFRPSVLPK
ncbi:MULTISPECIES: GlxA family transcriptional regulator [unclassified Paraburkholderia]|jgi:transcriptional regulator GlxA family with amidase domain|uniref:GlxA family transcriptional regulator n=1 Tax=unclassified Paraburkholderia TaxID=2615204 RepID=UPI0038BBC32A